MPVATWLASKLDVEQPSNDSAWAGSAFWLHRSLWETLYHTTLAHLDNGVAHTKASAILRELADTIERPSAF